MALLYTRLLHAVELEAFVMIKPNKNLQKIVASCTREVIKIL